MVANQDLVKRRAKKKVKYWSCGKKRHYTNKYHSKDKKSTHPIINKLINIKKWYLLNDSELLNKKIGIIIKLNIRIKADISILINW